MDDLIEKLRHRSEHYWLHGGPDCRLDAEAADEIERLRAALKALADRVEKVAFDMRPPNAHTPIFLALAQAARLEIAPRVDEQQVQKGPTK